MKFCITSRIDMRETIDMAQSLGWLLRESEHEVIYEKSVASMIGYNGVSISSQDFIADAIIVIGGDGSVLRTIRMLKHQIPIIGINQGHVGFLTDLERDVAIDILSSLTLPLNIESRMRISIEWNGECIGSALNEAVIVTSRPAKMLQFAPEVNGNTIGNFRADGLIIGTPTGSTAYAMSAGGPIVDPSIEAILLVPLAPYNLSSRPYLINSNSIVEIQLISNKPAQLVLDGQAQFEVGSDTSLTIRKAVEPALFVDVGRSFFDKVEKKLINL